MSRAGRAAVTFLVTAIVVALAVAYFIGFLRFRPDTVQAAPATARSANLVLQTVAAIGPKFGSRPDWVSYLIKSPTSGQWEHSTVWNLPADALIHVTIYQYDGASGLRNPLWGLPRGVVGNSVTINGRAARAIDPALASHTFAVPALGVSVPLQGVADNAKNQCAAAPCTLAEAHMTVQFTFRTGAPGTYRWQCMVPCAAGFFYGFGGPMQTVGYMDGLLHVQ